MSASTAPDVDRVLTRMGRSAFGYRSFPDRVEELAGIAAMPTLPAAEPEAPPSADATPAGASASGLATGGAAAPFALLNEAMAEAGAAAATTSAPAVARLLTQAASAGESAAPAVASAPSAARSARARPLPPDRSRPVMDTVPATALADVFRVVSGQEGVMPAPEAGPVRAAVAFPFRRR